MTLEERINNTFQTFLSEVEQIIKIKAGILYGSAVLNDFKEGKGDLDFMVFAAESLSNENCRRLYKLHEEYRNGSRIILFSQLEGAYYPVEVAGNPFGKNAGSCYIGTSRKGWKKTGTFANSLMDLELIRTRGRFYTGENIRKSIYKPGRDELFVEIEAKLKETAGCFWEKQSFGLAVATVHWFTRSLYFLEENKIGSKSTAIASFLEKHPVCKFKKLLLLCKTARYPYAEEKKNSDFSGQISEFIKNYAAELRQWMTRTEA